MPREVNMRKLACVFLSLFATATLNAQGVTRIVPGFARGAERGLPSDPETMALVSSRVVYDAPAEGEAVDISALPPCLRQVQGKTRQVVQRDSGYSALLFPSVGSVAGGGGTYFRSDVQIANNRNSDQNVFIFFGANSGPYAGSGLGYYKVLSARTIYFWRDFVGTFFGTSGLGYVTVFGDDAYGNVDMAASLSGSSRIWTAFAGGTVATSFPAVSPLDSFGYNFARALGNRIDGGFRSNVGIVNLDVNGQTHYYSVRVVSVGFSATFTVMVPPLQLVQTAIPFQPNGDIFVEITPDGSAAGEYWSAFVSTVDNVTGDGWVSHAAQP
jgi:hypothetical protein